MISPEFKDGNGENDVGNTLLLSQRVKIIQTHLRWPCLLGCSCYVHRVDQRTWAWLHLPTTSNSYSKNAKHLLPIQYPHLYISLIASLNYWLQSGGNIEGLYYINNRKICSVLPNVGLIWIASYPWSRLSDNGAALDMLIKPIISSRCWRGIGVDGTIWTNQRLLSGRIFLVIILTRIDHLPAHHTKESVECRGKKGSEQRTDPIDPVVPRKWAVDYIRSEGASRVERSSGVVIT